jgi:hypothetical protein
VRGKILIADNDNFTSFVPIEENEVKNTLSCIKANTGVDRLALLC